MDEYGDWTIGEIVDSMIRIRIKSNLSFAEKKEYNGLVEEIDRRFAFLAPEPSPDEVEEEAPLPEPEPEEAKEPEEETEESAEEEDTPAAPAEEG
ncbi:MAG: hypothetical protein ACYS8W_13095 [Planctomycetota bacterium]|jgi:ribosomal protein L12E/L44/L45/RPP1/RPP2